MAALVTAESGEHDGLALAGLGFEFRGEFVVYADLDCAVDLSATEFGAGVILQIKAVKEGELRTLSSHIVPPFENRRGEHIQVLRRAVRLPSGLWRIQLLIDDRVVATRGVRVLGDSP